AVDGCRNASLEVTLVPEVVSITVLQLTDRFQGGVVEHEADAWSLTIGRIDGMLEVDQLVCGKRRSRSSGNTQRRGGNNAVRCRRSGADRQLAVGDPAKALTDQATQQGFHAEDRVLIQLPRPLDELGVEGVGV